MEAVTASLVEAGDDDGDTNVDILAPIAPNISSCARDCKYVIKIRSYFIFCYYFIYYVAMHTVWKTVILL